MKFKNVNKKVQFLCLSLSLFLGTFNVSQAEESLFTYDHLYLHAGKYTHILDNPDYAGRNLLVGLEAVKSKDRVYGLALFDNSFGQFSQYFYIGKKWHHSGRFKNFHTKLTAGVLHGYKEPFHKELPLTTKSGWGPGIVPSFGYRKGKLGVDFMLLGYQGLMLSVGTKF